MQTYKELLITVVTLLLDEEKSLPKLASRLAETFSKIFMIRKVQFLHF